MFNTLGPRVQGVNHCPSHHLIENAEQETPRLHTMHALYPQVEAPTTTLESKTAYGALRGLETLSQLLDRVQPPPPQASGPLTTPSRRHAKPSLEGPNPGTELSDAGDGSREASSTVESGSRGGEGDTGQTPYAMGEGLILSRVGSSTSGFRDRTLVAGTLRRAMLASEHDQGSALVSHPGSTLNPEVPATATAATLGIYEVAGASALESAAAAADADGKSEVLQKGGNTYFTVNATVVRDAPRFAHRGLLIDTARHFLPVSIIKVSTSLLGSGKFTHQV